MSAKSKKNASTICSKTAILKDIWLNMTREANEDAGAAPVLEAFEPRILLSANPLSELMTDQEQKANAGNIPAVYAPSSAGSPSVGSAASGVAAPLAATVHTLGVDVVHNASEKMYLYQTVDFAVNASDSVGTISRTLTVNGDSVWLDASGKGDYCFEELGAYEIVATVRDAAGNTATKTFSIVVDQVWDDDDWISIEDESRRLAEYSYSAEVSGDASGREYTLSLTPGDRSVLEWRVDWGDGSSQTILTGGAKTIGHVYEQPGQYAVTVTLVQRVRGADLEGLSNSEWMDDSMFPQWTGYTPSGNYNQTFGVNARGGASMTLLDALDFGAGDEGELRCQAVTALLNAANPNVNYAYTVDEVLSMVRAAYSTNTTSGYRQLWKLFEAESNRGADLSTPATGNTGGMLEGKAVSFWKNASNHSKWEQIATGNTFNDIFGLALPSGNATLLNTLKASDDIEQEAMANAVAALLNAYHSGVNFLYTPEDVIALVRDAYASYPVEGLGVFYRLAEIFDNVNNLGANLNTLPTKTETVTIAQSVTIAESIFDTTAPVVDIAHNAPATMHPGQNVEFTVNASDDTGVVSRTLAINGQAVVLDAAGKAEFVFESVGIHVIVATASDAAGNVDSKTLTFEVIAVPDTTAPNVEIGHNAPETILPGQEVDFAVIAVDDKGVSSQTLTINGQAVALNADGGARYAFTEAGWYEVIATAIDDAGNIGTKAILLFVAEAADTEAPGVVIQHDGAGVVRPGQAVTITVTATDNKGVVSRILTINGQQVELNAQGQAIFTFENEGSYEIKAVAVDAAGNTGTYASSLEVVALPDIENPIVDITHNAPSTINPGQAVEFNVTAGDNVAVNFLEFTINGEKIELSAEGRALFIFTDLGLHEIKAIAIDAAGNIGIKEFTLTVEMIADTEEPIVSIEADKMSIKEGEGVKFSISADDNVGIVKLTLTINGKDVEIGANNEALYLFDSIGIYTALITAEDVAGNISTASVEIEVASVNDVKSPTVSITGPATNATISKAVSITGTIVDPDSAAVNWIVTLTDIEGKVWVVATGTGKFTNESICELNPSNFVNGTYTLGVVAEDPAGHRTVVSRTVKILSEYKVGNFELPFEDMKIDFGGMPINIIRTYNAENANYRGDFGYGWDLEYMPVSLKTNFKVDPRSSLFNSMDPACGFRVGTQILVTLPDGSTATFTAQASGSFLSYSIVFVCDRPGYSLSLAGASGLRLEGDLFTVSGFPYNPLSPWVAQPNANYTLTTSEGMSYIISSVTGLATEARNTKGERITIARDGFVSYNNAGQKIGEVKFERDSQNRITAVIDPEGNRIVYEYNANGDLFAVTNRAGERLEYGYVTEEGAPKHRLETITDARGVTAMRVMYDFVTGRIAGIVDAAGNPIGIGYTVQIGNGLTSEVITDAMGNITETVRDVNGSVIRSIQHIVDPAAPQDAALKQYLVTIYEYNSIGKLLGTARAFTVSEAELSGHGKTIYNHVPDDLFWTSRNTYDARGNLEKSIDAYGKETRYTYDAKGNLLTTTDPLGNKTTNEYNAQSLLTKTTDPSGTVMRYFYDGRGNLLYIEQTLPGGTPVRMSEMTYDSSGRLKTSTDMAGNITEYSYDGNGRCVETKTSVLDPQNPSVTHVRVTRTQYDGEGRVLATWQIVDGVEMSRTTNEYDGVGQLTATVDKYGLRTEYILDILGRTVETRRQSVDASGNVVWLVSRTVYDKNGRVTWQTDEHIEANPENPEAAWATHTIYDQLGREVTTERRSGVLVSVDPVDGFPVGVVSAEGTLVSRTAKGYDDAGRIWWSESESGVKTINVYDQYGAVEHTIIDLDGDMTTAADQQSSGNIVYDEYGRNVGQILDRDGNLSTTADQTATQYEYDAYGRVSKTIYADGTFTLVSYDTAGRKASETDQLGNTTYYEYDSDGRLTAVVLPKVQHPVTGGMVHVRYEYGYDASGNQISLIDNIFQEDPADASGIDRSGARETAFAYDWRGNQISRTLPDGSTEYFFHDEIGRQIRHVSFEGRVTILEYDAYGRLARKLYFTSEIAWDNGNGISGHKISYAYDAFGRLAMESDSKQGTTRTEYDEMGRVLRVDSPQGVINYEYDIMTGQVSRTWSGLDAEHPVSDIVNTYDTLGRLETVTTYAREGAALTNPEATRYIYDIIGNLDRIVNSNGVISDYTYDELNRLKDLTHYAPDSTPETLSGNTVLQRYEYSYHANGNKSGEVFTDAEGRVHTWDWVYDALGRLTRESHDSADDSLDYSTDYAYDLVGNRLRKDTDKGNDGSIEEAIVSQFDANDRHLNDMKILNGATVERTEYIYNKTEQIAKTVTDLVNSRIASRTRMEYNVQGRMSRIIIETYVNGQLAKTVVQEYVYDSSGIKVKQTETVDEDADGLVDSEKITEYLNVKENHTGYSQVLEERTAENGGSMKVMTYTVGHDVLTQANALFGVLTLLADGHGSTRAVSDSLGGIAQQYSYDAYGNAVGFDPSQAMTNLLYSGEQFNPVSGLQYLRARWYNPQSGTFNRLDPYSGNKQSPLSFHKYAYAHMNPVMGTDPSGEFISILANFAYTNALRAYQLITAGFYLNVAKLAVSASAVIQNAYANMRVPYISNPDTAFRLGLIGGSIGAIVGFAINNTWFFSGLSAALISSATEAVNLFYAQTYQDQEVITLDNAPYFVGKMIEVALLTICGTLVAPVVDSIKSPLISILSDIGFGVGIDAITSVFSSIPENAITSIRNSLRR